ncbi:hypothetical protein FXO21_02015 [Dyadobacter sp. UC 10]|nr:hypothetical protein FXO21_02015 [Dyadobacter sp. UC 10]
MAQLVQNLYWLLPYITIGLLMLATVTGVWLITQLKKNSGYQGFASGDRLFMKRNASRLRKMQLH